MIECLVILKLMPMPSSMPLEKVWGDLQEVKYVVLRTLSLMEVASGKREGSEILFYFNENLFTILNV